MSVSSFFCLLLCLLMMTSKFFQMITLKYDTLQLVVSTGANPHTSQSVFIFSRQRQTQMGKACIANIFNRGRLFSSYDLSRLKMSTEIPEKFWLTCNMQVGEGVRLTPKMLKSKEKKINLIDVQNLKRITKPLFKIFAIIFSSANNIRFKRFQILL